MSRYGDEEHVYADLIITDRPDKLANVHLSGKDVFDGQPILVVQNDIGCRPETRQYHLRVGDVRAPIGPFKLARCILAVLDQDISPTTLTRSNKSTRGGPIPSSSPVKHLSTQTNPFSDYGPTQPPNTLPNPSESPSHDDFVQKPTPASSPQTPVEAMSQTPTEVPPSSSLERKLLSDPPDSEYGLHILAVDDNVLNLRLIHRYLLKRGSDFVSIARNGIEAVSSVQEAANKGTHFDIIFMDISMPEMDGFEATRLIRSFERSFAHRCASEDSSVANTHVEKDTLIKDKSEGKEQGGSLKKGVHRAYVVALTGLASRRDRDEAEASGFDNFLTKPVSFEKIKDILEQLRMEKGAEKWRIVENQS